MMEQNNQLQLAKIEKGLIGEGYIFKTPEFIGLVHRGYALKRKIEKMFRKHLVDRMSNNGFIEAPIIIPKQVLENSKHVQTIGNELYEVNGGYLRPETCQSIFANIKSIIQSYGGKTHGKLPFGLVQIGKSFRKEIKESEFLFFRSKEFTQLELEFFFHYYPSQMTRNSNKLKEKIYIFLKSYHSFNASTKVADYIFNEENGKEVEESKIEPHDLPHYSQKTIDIHYKFSFGGAEVGCINYRSDYDLKSHFNNSDLDLSVGGGKIPHVIEVSFGLERLILALMEEIYNYSHASKEK